MTDQPGATPAEPPATGGTDEDTTAQNLLADAIDSEPLGEGGVKALRAEREAREALEKQLKELEPLKGLAELKPLAELLGGKSTGDTKSDLEKLTERMAELEKSAATERLGRLRLEVATEKKLPAGLAARLNGNTREELAADADVLLAALPTAPTAPGTPKPDMSQGAKGGAPDLDAQIRDAESKGDWMTAVALKNQKLINQK